MAVLGVPNGSMTFPLVLGYITPPEAEGISPYRLSIILLLLFSLLYFPFLFWAVPIKM
jgi:hypothetical protein